MLLQLHKKKIKKLYFVILSINLKKNKLLIPSQITN